MPNGVYEINININGATPRTRADILPENQQTTEFITEEEFQEMDLPSITPQRQVQPVPQKENLLSTTRAKVGATIGVSGALAYQHMITSAEINGDTTKLNRLNDAKQFLNYGTTIAAGFIAGGPVGGALAVGYMAFDLAQQNRKLINGRQIDQFQSKYYQRRLINDVSGRSRI